MKEAGYHSNTLHPQYFIIPFDANVKGHGQHSGYMITAPLLSTLQNAAIETIEGHGPHSRYMVTAPLLEYVKHEVRPSKHKAIRKIYGAAIGSYTSTDFQKLLQPGKKVSYICPVPALPSTDFACAIVGAYLAKDQGPSPQRRLYRPPFVSRQACY